jgi:oligoribonuclease (3'-5' exoribonuclease)
MPARERKEESKHRALDDILKSIKELQFYRENIFKEKVPN